MAEDKTYLENTNVVNFADKKAKLYLSKNSTKKISEFSSSIDEYGAGLYLHPRLKSLLGEDREPDYIIQVDPNSKPDFNFNGGEKWPTTPREDRVEWHISPLNLNERYELFDIDTLKLLFGDLLLRHKPQNVVIEIELICYPKFNKANSLYVFSFNVSLQAIYIESVEERNCIPEFWFSYSQNFYTYLIENHENFVNKEQSFTLNLRYNRSGMFWELKNPEKNDFII